MITNVATLQNQREKTKKLRAPWATSLRIIRESWVKTTNLVNSSLQFAYQLHAKWHARCTQTSSVMKLSNTIQGTCLKNLIGHKFFSLHLMTSLWHLLQHLSASLLKLTPQNNSMLPLKESDWPYKLFFCP
jgi:hypothetical protein